MSRFVFSFEGESHLSEREFFAGDVPDSINNENVFEQIEDVSIMDLIDDWYLLEGISVTLRDLETGATWVNSGHGWEMVAARKTLPGEQRLFE